MADKPLIKLFDTIGMDDVGLVGGKNASLGEMVQYLVPQGIPIPPGFAVTSHAYWLFLDATGLRDRIRDLLSDLSFRDLKNLELHGKRVREAIRSATIPEALQAEVLSAYHALVGNGPADVAVRSSATAEDLPGASFAGQQESYLNVHGDAALMEAVRNCYASLFTDRAIVYREENGFDHLKVALSVGVQKMVRSDLACSGVMFTLDTESGFQDVVLINAAYGLGESVVQGKVNPDQLYVFKPTLTDGHRPIVGRRLGSKETKIIYQQKGQTPTTTIAVPAGDRQRFCVTDDEVLALSNYAVTIEKYYSERIGHAQPMDIEWAKDGNDGALYIVQARPETVEANKDRSILEEYHLDKKGRVLTKGLAVGARIGSGRVRVLEDVHHLSDFQAGDVLVARMTDPDWVPVMKRAAAIVTDSGGRTCHAAIVSRELGTPAVVGTGDAMSVLKDGDLVTVSCAEGEQGRVYAGALPFHVEKTDLGHVDQPTTKIMLNLADPDQAFEYSFIPNHGVGLARLEFVFINSVGIHPLALLHPERVQDVAVREEIERRTRGYGERADYMVERLAEGVGRIAAAFYPNDVIVRASDFKTNEYAELLGGKDFEPTEANPMIGWRGSSRYYDPKYEEAFLLECRAFRKVREEMGLTNLVVMIPFCRTPEEGKAVLNTMAKAGLVRGKDGLRVYVMVEIPSNVILAEEFAELFDGFSIGSNDLTQLILGVDRDSEIVSHLYQEKNEAVLRAIRHVIRVGKERKIKVGICGQAPSDDPAFAEFLVREGIDSISLNPDTVLKTTIAINALEKKLKKVKK